jgi:hypothetical protein
MAGVLPWWPDKPRARVRQAGQFNFGQVMDNLTLAWHEIVGSRQILWLAI